MLNLKHITLSILLLSLSAILFGTAQIPDILVFEGKEYRLHTNPLEPYFEQFPEKRPTEGFSTALWRGYVAKFEFIDDQLYLIDISVLSYKEEEDGSRSYYKSVMQDVFPGIDRYPIDWFTGLLVVPYGRMKKYVHMGYASTYSKYLLFELDQGKMNEIRKFRNREYEKFRRRQYLAFKETEEYQKLYKELSESEEADPEFIESFIEIYVIQYTSKILIE
jgi:hypothetical protein